MELEWNFLPILAINLGQVFRNCFVRAQRSHLKKTNVFRKATSFFLFLDFQRNVFWALGNENIGMFVKTEFCLFTEICFEKTKIKQFLVCFLLDFRRKLSEILANYLGASLSELPCKCPDESFGKKVLDNLFSSVMMSRRN